jgi:hypothetical protein
MFSLNFFEEVVLLMDLCRIVEFRGKVCRFQCPVFVENVINCET